MHKLTTALLLGCLMAGAAHAAPGLDAVQAYAGTYQLADGRMLTVTEQDGLLHASIASRAAAALKSRTGNSSDVILKEAGPARFVSTSTPLEITFDKGADGDVAQVTLSGRAPMMASR